MKVRLVVLPAIRLQSVEIEIFEDSVIATQRFAGLPYARRVVRPKENARLIARAVDVGDDWIQGGYRLFICDRSQVVNGKYETCSLGHVGLSRPVLDQLKSQVELLEE